MAPAFAGNDFVLRSGAESRAALRWRQQAGIDGFSQQLAPDAAALPLGVEFAARSLQLPPAVDRDNGEFHALRGRTVPRSADHCADPARPDIRSLALASRRRSRHANTEAGNLRTSAMLPDSDRPCWRALPSGQAQCSGFHAQRVPASPCCGPADTCAERRARHANTKHATTATPEAIKLPVTP